MAVAAAALYISILCKLTQLAQHYYTAHKAQVSNSVYYPVLA
jgi:hypothetical protein